MTNKTGFSIQMFAIGTPVIVHTQSQTVRTGHVSGRRITENITGVSNHASLMQVNSNLVIEYQVFFNEDKDERWWEAGRVFDDLNSLSFLKSFIQKQESK